jgi:hypothetical protein
VTIHCDLQNENLANLIWRRSNYDGSNNLLLFGSNIPSRYLIQTTGNTSVGLSTLRIIFIEIEDFASFECMSGTSDRKNLIELRMQLSYSLFRHISFFFNSKNLT